MKTFYASTAGEWRSWLAQNSGSEKEVWLVICHSRSVIPSPRYHEAIEHALCYGWIDSQARQHGADSSVLRFTPRRPGSTWSRVNRERAARMTARGLMTSHGQAMIDLAKATGTWQVLSAAGSSAIPSDLREPLDQNEAARRNFHNFPPSSKRLILEWIAKAKRPDTRQRRINQAVELAAINVRANHPARYRPQPQCRGLRSRGHRLCRCRGRQRPARTNRAGPAPAGGADPGRQPTSPQRGNPTCHRCRRKCGCRPRRSASKRTGTLGWRRTMRTPN